MSEVDTRPTPTRGRGSVRGGRGGYGRGGPRAGHRQPNGTSKDHDEPVIDEQGEIGDMKKQYSSQLPVLKDMFPDWTDVDLVFALQETGGDLETTILHITEGHVSQFSEIKKTKDRARSKVKETGAPDHATASSRGGRGRGALEGGRGGRGRGDRARGVSRGGRAGAAPASKDNSAAVAATTASDANAWGSNEATTGSWDAPDPTTNNTPHSNVVTSDVTPKTASEGAKPSLLPESSAKKTWASMFNLPKAAPAPPKQSQPKPAAETPVAEVPAALAPESEQEQELASTSAVPAIDTEQISASLEEEQTPAPILEPPRDPLTEDNLEHLPDTSHPPATHTVASTVGSVDARQATPAGLGQQTPIGRPLGGYASTAMRAAGMGSRSASFQRRVAEQQEAVVLPGHNSVDRAAVQFGSMGLSGDSVDVDDEREEPETRTQPPPQSPQALPRASLPPTAAAPSEELSSGQAMPTPKQAPGLPPVNAQAQQAPQTGIQEFPGSVPQQSYNQYERYGQQNAPAGAQKSYDPFSHQTPAYDQFNAQSQSAQQQQQQGHQQSTPAQQPQQHQQQPQQGQESGFGSGSYSQAPSDYSQYYTAEQQRYQQYYGSQYGQQQSHGQQDASGQQQRAGGSYGAGQAENAYGSHQGSQQHLQDRYGNAQGSGQNTPNPAGGQQQSSAPGQQQQQQSQQQQHQQSQYNSSFPYGHPYYQSPYAAAYSSQFGGYYNNSPYGNKGGMYGQPHGGYGMNAPSSYDHASSPANGSFGQQQSSMQSRDSGVSGSSEYGRTSSTQPSSVGGAGFGGASDYGRSQSGYQGHSQGYSAQHGGASEDLKSFENKTGPSPSLAQAGRPGSAVSGGTGQQSHSGLPPPQAQQQQSFGGYPGFNQSSGYGSGLGGLGGQQGGQGGYAQYGGGAGAGGSGFGQSYSQYRGGWGGAGYGH